MINTLKMIATITVEVIHSKEALYIRRKSGIKPPEPALFGYC